MSALISEHCLYFCNISHRFYSPVTPGRWPLLYYAPIYPKIDTEVNAVVCHINNPADFYIQLVRKTWM